MSTTTRRADPCSPSGGTGGTISSVIWVLIFGGVALLAVVTAVSYGVWLAHKVSDLYSEVRMLGQRATEAGELLGRIQLPSGRHD